MPRSSDDMPPCLPAGLGTVVYSPIIAARQRAGLSHFVALLGVSLQEVPEAVELKPGQEARQAGRQGNLSAVRCGVFRVLAERPRLPTHPAR